MNFIKNYLQPSGSTRVEHCTYCDCGDTEKSNVDRSQSKATGG